MTRLAQNGHVATATSDSLLPGLWVRMAVAVAAAAAVDMLKWRSRRWRTGSWLRDAGLMRLRIGEGLGLSSSLALHINYAITCH